ncbi:hypothetical protein [Polaromonas sp. CG_9.11]|uniref:hypothetical protein n=1 Tax=Polaromonas sp. CG_9.11 TaxID=2787730 RepID=UPI001A1F9704|nr:hypothetical protein [Polaromonas sp. CG_9.11]MBG6075843.1 hypothetical protein [Polaromonas sp. CG_9.11]
MPTAKVSANCLFFLRFVKPVAWTCLAASACLNAVAQGTTGGDLPTVTISAKANPDPVEKSYRKMISAMDLFDQERGLRSPDATLRFKLLPRRPDTNMQRIEMEVVGSTVDFGVPIAPDQTFTLARSQKAYDENAQVSPNRRAQSMTWRSQIKTPGLPPDTRRLGDLRMECRVGMEAGLISNPSNLVGRMVKAVLDTPAYCDRQVPLYLFFADRPLFSVALVAGPRREILPIDMLYAAASDDPKLKDELPYCDCEVLVDRTYVLPLGDRSWPDDTRVEFEYMEDE